MKPALLIAAALAALAPAGAAPAAPALEARVRLLEDREEIARVLMDYGRLLDGRDFKGYAALFASDGEWVGGFGSARGPAAIQAMMEKEIRPRGAGGMPDASYHLLSSFEIEVAGDTATAWSRWSFVMEGQDRRGVIVAGGRYEDELVREAGRWRFKRRVVHADVPAAGAPATTR